MYGVILDFSSEYFPLTNIGMEMLKKIIGRIEAERSATTQKQMFIKRIATDRGQRKSCERYPGIRTRESSEFQHEATAPISLVGNMLGLSYLRRCQKA